MYVTGLFTNINTMLTSYIGVILVRIHLITGRIKHWGNCCFNNYNLFFIDHTNFTWIL